MIIGCARESTSKTEQDQAFEYQIHRLTEYGCDHIYKDRESGRKDYRKTHEKILEGIKSGEITEVVATSMSRLGRSVLAIQRIISAIIEAQKNGRQCKLTLLDSEVNLESAMGRAFLLQQAVFAQMESEMIGERVASGWSNVRRLGKASRPCFGYKSVNGVYQFDKTLTEFNITPYELAIEIVETFLDKKSLRSIIKMFRDRYPFLSDTNKLYDAAPRCPRTPTGLKDWLTSETLIGNLVFYTPEITLYPNTHEPLISINQHREIKEILQYNKEHHGWNLDTSKNPIRGKVKCQACKNLCSFATIKVDRGAGKYYYYRCSNKILNCTEGKSVRLEAIEHQIQMAIMSKAEIIAREGREIKQKKEPDTKELELIAQLQFLESVPGFNVAIEEAKRTLRTELDTLRMIADLTQEESKSEIDDPRLKAFSDSEFWQTRTEEMKKQIYKELVSSVWILGGSVVGVDLRF